MTCLPTSYNPGQGANSLPFLSRLPGGLKEVVEVEIQEMSKMVDTDSARWKDMDVSEM